MPVPTDPLDAARRLLEGKPHRVPERREEPEVFEPTRTTVKITLVGHEDRRPVTVSHFRYDHAFIWWTKSDGVEVGVPHSSVRSVEIETTKLDQPTKETP